jgi:hypothetical protein
VALCLEKVTQANLTKQNTIFLRSVALCLEKVTQANLTKQNAIFSIF